MEAKTTLYDVKRHKAASSQRSGKSNRQGWNVVHVKPGLFESGIIKTISGSCYGISATKMNRNYGYVEGVIISKKTKEMFPHAWNIDAKGRHVDFTKDPRKYIYIGKEIPADVVWKVARNSGYGWFSVLPHIDENYLECSIYDLVEEINLSQLT
ncbi:MAG: hypothetical protein QNK30_11650 [Bacteroidales bacterium]|nr:hypothetical protein [Bacteroidales bacterium]